MHIWKNFRSPWEPSTPGNFNCFGNNFMYSTWDMFLIPLDYDRVFTEILKKYIFLNNDNFVTKIISADPITSTVQNRKSDIDTKQYIPNYFGLR